MVLIKADLKGARSEVNRNFNRGVMILYFEVPEKIFTCKFLTYDPLDDKPFPCY